jgi:hypothetical protein
VYISVRGRKEQEMRNRRRTWFLKRLALGVAVAAIAAPAAQAYPDLASQSALRVESQSALRVEGTVCVPKWGCRASGPIRPDDRAVRGVPATSERLPVRADDKVLNLEPTVGVEPVQVASKADGFDWSDAGVGAGLAFGLMLLAAGATLGTRHHRSATA